MSKVQATYSGFVGHEGVPVPLHEGDEFDSEHPLVQARPELFTSPPARRGPAKVAAARGKPKDADG